MKFTFRHGTLEIEQCERDRVKITASTDTDPTPLTLVLTDLEADAIAFVLAETAKRCREQVS